MNGEKNPVTPPTGWQFKSNDADQKTTPAAPQHNGVLEDPRSEVGTSSAVSDKSQTELPPSIGSDTAHQPQTEAKTPPAAEPQTDYAEADDVDHYSAPQQRTPDIDRLEWAATDNTAHAKPAGWTAMLVFGALVLAGLIYVVTRDVVSTGSVVGAALLYVAFSAHKAPSVRYILDAHGIVIGQKHYPYEQFRSFSVVEDGAASSVVLMPLKRFMPLLTIHYKPELEDEVIATFADRLPMEAYKRDAMDAIIKKLRF